MTREKRSRRRNQYERHETNNNEAPPNSHPDKNVLVQEDGTVSFPFAILMIGVVMFVSGRWLTGFLVFVLGFILAGCNSAMDQLREEDKQEIRYNIFTAEDVVRELITWKTAVRNAANEENKMDLEKMARIHCIVGLEALAKKCGKQQQQLIMASKNSQQRHPNNNGEKSNQQASAQTTTTAITSDHQLELLCQQAAYIAYRLFPGHDNQVVAAALSLHAMVAKDPQVRQRHLFEADAYGLDLPIQCMRQALTRAKEETNEDRELQAAELQRKACLLLGALGDGDVDVATRLVEEDGLEAVLEIMDWFRYHEDIANWALYAVFILSYENPHSKVRTVELGGVGIIIHTLRNNTNCLEVARHGIAILFDLMRDEDKSSAASSSGTSSHKQLDIWRIRKSALAAGLHEVVLRVMEQFSSAFDIIMMGQEILAGTGYQGHVPAYQPNKEDIAE